jgi:hypothetical protein
VLEFEKPPHTPKRAYWLFSSAENSVKSNKKCAQPNDLCHAFTELVELAPVTRNQCVPVSGKAGIRYIKVRDRIGVQWIVCRKSLGQPGRKHRYPDCNSGGPRSLSFNRQQGCPATRIGRSRPAKLVASPSWSFAFSLTEAVAFPLSL